MVATVFGAGCLPIVAGLGRHVGFDPKDRLDAFSDGLGIEIDHTEETTVIGDRQWLAGRAAWRA